MAGTLRRGRVGARVGRRLTRILVCTALAAGMLPAGSARAGHYSDTEELTATDVVGVSVAFSKRAFPNGAVEAVVGRDDVFADSLASGSLQAGRPLILTNSQALSAAAKAELERLGVKTVHVLGGTGAVSEAVEQELTAAGYTVQRHSGPTRIETATAVANYVAAGASTVIVARAFAGGTDATQAFADALAAGGWAAESGSPIVLTESERLSAPTQAYLDSSDPTTVYVVGGTAAVSDAVLAQIEALGAEAVRVAGATRFDTAIEIAKRRGAATAADADRVILLDGQKADGWASGFASAALSAAGTGAPVVLSNGAELPEPTQAWLTGGNGSLICAPSASLEACGAAAEKLGKLASPKVTLNANTVAEFANLSGKVEPANRVASLTADGCGVQQEAITRNQDGSFSVRVPGPMGECTIAFRIVDAEGTAFTSEFPITVTEGAPATSRPYLKSASVAETQAEYVVVRFTFSEVVHQLYYQEDDQRQFFWLYGPEGVDDATPEANGPTAAPSRDPNDNRSVLVRFARANFEAATTAAAGLWAALEVDGPVGDPERPNLPGSVPLRERLYPGARVEGAPDLTSVGTATVQGVPPGKFRVTYTYDSAISGVTLDADDHLLVLSDGKTIPGETAFPQSAAVIVEFDPTDALLPSGTACSGSTCPTLQQAVNGVRRGVVDFNGERRQAAAVVQSGATDLPDLTEVKLDLTAGKADFTFDQASTGTGAVALFHLYDRYGTAVAADSVERVSDTVVRATFAEGAVHRGIVGAWVDRGAVTATGGDAQPAAVGIPQTLPVGFTFGPQLVRGTSTLVGSDPNATPNPTKDYEIRWIFDRDIAETFDDEAFVVVTNSGDFLGVSECERPDARTIVCKVLGVVDDEGVPAMAVADWGAVESARQVFGVAHTNVEKAVRL